MSLSKPSKSQLVRGKVKTDNCWIPFMVTPRATIQELKCYLQETKGVCMDNKTISDKSGLIVRSG